MPLTLHLECHSLLVGCSLIKRDLAGEGWGGTTVDLDAVFPPVTMLWTHLRATPASALYT